MLKSRFIHIGSTAKVSLLSATADIIQHAHGAVWDPEASGTDLHEEWTRKSVAEARKALDQIEALLNAADEAEAA